MFFLKKRHIFSLYYDGQRPINEWSKTGSIGRYLIIQFELSNLVKINHHEPRHTYFQDKQLRFLDGC